MNFQHIARTVCFFVLVCFPGLLLPSTVLSKDLYLYKKARKFINQAVILQEVDALEAEKLLRYVLRKLPPSSFLYKEAMRELKRLKKFHPTPGISPPKRRTLSKKTDPYQKSRRFLQEALRMQSIDTLETKKFLRNILKNVPKSHPLFKQADELFKKIKKGTRKAKEPRDFQKSQIPTSKSNYSRTLLVWEKITRHLCSFEVRACLSISCNEQRKKVPQCSYQNEYCRIKQEMRKIWEAK